MSSAPNEGREEKQSLEEVLTSHRLSYSFEADNETGLSLVDKLTPFDDNSIERGKDEITFLAEVIESEVILPLRDQLSKEREMRKELVESLKDTIRNVPFDASGNSVVYAIESVLKKASELDKNKTY